MEHNSLENGCNGSYCEWEYVNNIFHGWPLCYIFADDHAYIEYSIHFLSTKFQLKAQTFLNKN